MKNRSALLLFVIVFCASCSGGGGVGANGPASLDGIEEGSGVALDISRTDEISRIVSNVIGNVQTAFSSVDSVNGTKSLSPQQPMEKSGDISGLADKGLKSYQNEFMVNLCKNGTSGRVYDLSLTGAYGSATIDGSENAAMDGEDKSVLTLNLEGSFFDYLNSAYSASGSRILVKGQASMEGSSTVEKGMTWICDMWTKEGSSGREYSQSESIRLYGVFSLSGSVGAAMSFDFTNTMSTKYSEPVSHGDTWVYAEPTHDIDFSGSAKFKSGGKEISCTISEYLGSMKIACQQ